MAKKAASPKTSKAKELKDNSEIETESNDKVANRSKRTKSSPAKKTKKSEDEAAEPPTKENRKRKAAESEDNQKETNNDGDAVPKGEEEDATAADKPNDNKNADHGDDDAAKSAAAPEKPDIDLTKPIKKARTAYFIFSDEHRDEIKAKHKGEGVAVLARELGQMWSKMTDEEKGVYQEKAAMEREQVAQQLAQLQAAGIDLKDIPGAAQATDPNNPALIIPMARVRRIVKLDPEVKNMSKEACLLVTKCTELFIAQLGIETVRTAQIQNRRKLLPDDIANVTQTREQFLFLRDDVKDLVREQVVQKQKEKGAAAGSNSREAKAASNSKPLTAYFAAKSS